MRWRILLGVAVSGGLVAATPFVDQSSEELLRQGNEAFLRDDLDAAEHFYKLAEERTGDPGLVAFNKATVLMQKGEVRDAELHYLRALDDQAAPPERRAKALYNRGVCLLARGGGVGVYRSAIACFEQALDLLSLADPLAADARHNLELAKLIWNKAREKEQKKPLPNEPPPDVPDPPDSEPEKTGSDANPGGDGKGPTSVKPEQLVGQPPFGKAPRSTNQKTPGAGNLPVQLDDANTVQPLTPEDTRAMLQKLAERLEQERKANARLVAGPERPHVRDW